MKISTFLLVLAAFSAIVSHTGASVVIGGSTLTSPPPFWQESYYGMTSGLERACSFTTVSGGPFRAETLQIAAFYYSFQSGSHARFTINLNNNGTPGAVIGTFETNSIPRIQWPETSYTPRILNIQAGADIILDPDTTYWLTGQTLQQQFNWHLADSVFGTVAYRQSQGQWSVLQNGNLAAFAILGTPLPEPSTLLLLTLAGLLLKKNK